MTRKGKRNEEKEREEKSVRIWRSRWFADPPWISTPALATKESLFRQSFFFASSSLFSFHRHYHRTTNDSFFITTIFNDDS
jgi:hypothetical protein